MKTYFQLLISFLCIYSTSIFAQAPQFISYQAVARDNSNNLYSNQSVTVRISIRDISANGTILYRETHNAATNNHGLFNLNIGAGTFVSGSFSSINWAVNSKFLQVEMDPAGGSTFIDMGTQQMMSVPFALYSAKTNIPSGTSAGQILIWNGTGWEAGSICSLFASDENNCGSCGNVCPAGYNCINGTCVLNCPGGQVNCNGSCSDPVTDINNCGQCGNACINPNGTTACIAGACTPVCNTGFANCDGNSANGCETSTSSNISNCGGCGIVCPNRPNSTRTCVNGICAFICNSNFADCNGITTDGCEVDLRSNASHCNSCGNQCPPGKFCVNGVCQ